MNERRQPAPLPPVCVGDPIPAVCGPNEVAAVLGISYDRVMTLQRQRQLVFLELQPRIGRRRYCGRKLAQWARGEWEAPADGKWRYFGAARVVGR